MFMWGICFLFQSCFNLQSLLHAWNILLCLPVFQLHTHSLPHTPAHSQSWLLWLPISESCKKKEKKKKNRTEGKPHIFMEKGCRVLFPKFQSLRLVSGHCCGCVKFNTFFFFFSNSLFFVNIFIYFGRREHAGEYCEALWVTPHEQI